MRAIQKYERNASKWLYDKLSRKDKVIGFDSPIFTTLFVMSRLVGWTAHIMEQAASNALIRPLSDYSGRPQRSIA